MKRLLKTLYTIFTVFMICALVVLMCMGWLNISGKPFHIFGYALLRVQTGSMAPTYEEGDFLISRETDAASLKKGDIITFYSSDPRIEGMLNTHRIVDIERINGERVFTTKGDAAEKADSYTVKEENIFGITIKRVDFLRWLAKVLAIPWVFGAIVFFPLILMIVGEVKTIMRAIRRLKLNRQLEALGLDPEDTTVSALAEKYGIEIFLNAAEEIKSDVPDGGEAGSGEADTEDMKDSENEGNEEKNISENS